VPLHNKRLRNCDWKPAEDKIEAKLHTWQGNFLSYGGRVVLLRGCLSNVPLYMLSFYEIPKRPLNGMPFFMKRLPGKKKKAVGSII
jgi:hypothetical protein